MNSREGTEFADLDAYVRAQLDGAAEAYTAHVDIAARLTTVMEAAQEKERDENDGGER